jgi:hypothetical protein
MVFLAQTHNYILERGDTLTIQVEDGTTQHLREIQHCLNSH